MAMREGGRVTGRAGMTPPRVGGGNLALQKGLGFELALVKFPPPPSHHTPNGDADASERAAGSAGRGEGGG